jgi:hypothetical protein
MRTTKLGGQGNEQPCFYMTVLLFGEGHLALIAGFDWPIHSSVDESHMGKVNEAVSQRYVYFEENCENNVS